MERKASITALLSSFGRAIMQKTKNIRFSRIILPER